MDQKLIPYKKQGKWGFCDCNKTIIIDCKYKAVEPFNENRLAAVSNEHGKWGIINKSAEQIMPCIYDEIKLLPNNRIITKVGSKATLHDQKRKKNFFKTFQDIKYLGNNFYLVSDRQTWKMYINEDQTIIYNHDNDFLDLGWGGDNTSALIELFKTTKLYSLEMQLERKLKSKGYNSMLHKGRNISILINSLKFNLFNEKDQVLLYHNPEEIELIRDENIAIISKGDDRNKDYNFGIVDFSGEILLPFDRQYIKYIGEGYFYIQKDGVLTIINKFGKLLIEDKFEEVGSFNDGFSIVYQGGKCSVLDVFGKRHLTGNYDSIGDFNNGLAIVKQQDKYGIIDKKFTEIIPCNYAFLSHFNDGRFIFKYESNALHGLLDNSGRVIVPCIYYKIEPFSRELLLVDKCSNEMGLIFQNSIQFLPCKYSWIKSPMKNCYYVGSGYKRAFYVGGNKIFDLMKDLYIYDFNNSVEHGLLMVEIDGETLGYIDQQGNKYWDEIDYENVMRRYNLNIERKKKIEEAEESKTDVDWSSYNEDLDPDQQSEDFWNQF